MIWFSEETEHFPRAVRQAMLPEGTMVQSRYRITRGLRVSGMELTCLAADTETQTDVHLHMLLPMRWCMRTEEGIWTPYHSAAEAEFSLVKAAYLARTEHLQSLQKEIALEEVLDTFEENGTLMMVTTCGEETPRSLSQEMEARVYTLEEAIDILAPVLDTLVGLHAQELYHGAISEQTIVLCGEDVMLTDWAACFCEEHAEDASVRSDVRDVCLLLFRMMTGEKTYSKKAIASLSAPVRSALQNGMEAEEMTIEMLWTQLHGSGAAPRLQRASDKKEALPVSAASGRNWGGIAVAFCLLCCLLPVLVWAVLAGSSRLPDYVRELAADEVIVPDLLYLTQDEAMAQAQALGLHVIIASREENPSVPADAVIMQSPKAGTGIRAGGTLTLTISDGWQNYVPNVVNMRIEDAISALEELGFFIKYQEVSSTEYAPGTVISQSIKAGTLLNRESILILKVSLGRDDVDPTKYEEVGNYVGMDFEEAQALLADLYLYALQAETVYDPEVPAGVIISQDIPEGSKVPQGTSINMVVSLGVETTRVPRVTLLDSAAAKRILEEAGLKAVITYVADPAYAKDCVISQNVVAGDLVPKGSEVWITVSTGEGSAVISTGGWSGDPLPTVETTATTVTTQQTTVTETQAPTTEEPTEPETTVTTTAEPTEPETTTVPAPTDPPAELETTSAPAETEPPATDPPEESEDEEN